MQTDADGRPILAKRIGRPLLAYHLYTCETVTVIAVAWSGSVAGGQRVRVYRDWLLARLPQYVCVCVRAKNLIDIYLQFSTM